MFITLSPTHRLRMSPPTSDRPMWWLCFFMLCHPSQNKFGAKKRPPPPAGCIPLWESCKTSGKVCCDFCAFCQCRIFRTVCYCRMGNPRCWATTRKPELAKLSHYKSTCGERCETGVTARSWFISFLLKFTAWKHFITEDCTTVNILNLQALLQALLSNSQKYLFHFQHAWLKYFMLYVYRKMHNCSILQWTANILWGFVKWIKFQSMVSYDSFCVMLFNLWE